MIKNYSVNENRFGYLLINLVDVNDKMVLYESKNINSIASHYLKQVEPIEEFFSGMFYDKKKLKYSGRTKAGQRITIKINSNIANLQIQ